MKQNKSVIRILNVLELLAKHPEGLTLSEVYRKLAMPKATAHDILQTLYSEDAIYYKNPQLKNYVIGAKMYSIGAVYVRGSNLIDEGDPLLKQFSNKHKVATFISKYYEDKVIYVYKYQAPQSFISVPLEPGMATIHSNDVVKATFLHFINSKQLEFKVFKGAINNFDYISAISAPIFNFENKCVCAIVSCDLKEREHISDLLISEFKEIAQQISQKLGYLIETIR